MWCFQCYTSSRGDNEIQQWYESLDDTERGLAKPKLDHLRFAPKHMWRDPYVHPLENSDGLSAIRIRIRGVAHRITGFFREERNEFVMLYHFKEKNTKADYARAINISNDRKQRILRNEAGTIEYTFK